MLSNIVSFVSLFISGAIFWLLYLKKGRILMTQPTLLVISNDINRDGKKFFLRTHLFSTSKRGNTLESLFIKVKNSELSEIFRFWSYGEIKNLVRGSGLYISEVGCTFNHHFLLTPRHTDYNFIPGQYHVEIVSRIFNKKNKFTIKELKFFLTEKHCNLIQLGSADIFFHWNEESEQYYPEVVHKNLQ